MLSTGPKLKKTVMCFIEKICVLGKYHSSISYSVADEVSINE